MKKGHSEVYSMVLSALLHCLVLTGLIALKADPAREGAAMVKVLLVEDRAEKKVNAEKNASAVLRKHHVPKTVIRKGSMSVPSVLDERQKDQHAVGRSMSVKEVEEKAANSRKEVDEPVQPEEVMLTRTNGTEDQEVQKKQDGIEEIEEKQQEKTGAVPVKDIFIGDFGKGDGPRFLKKVSPAYPLYARRSGREGRVLLKLFINENGSLEEVAVIESAGYGFDRSAVKAVKMSTFLPAHVNGIPVRSMTRLPVRFVLTD